MISLFNLILAILNKDNWIRKAILVVWWYKTQKQRKYSTPEELTLTLNIINLPMPGDNKLPALYIYLLICEY